MMATGFATAVLAWSAIAGAAVAQDRQTVVKAGSVAAKPGPAADFTGRVTVRAPTRPAPPGQAGTALATDGCGCGWTQVEPAACRMGVATRRRYLFGASADCPFTCCNTDAFWRSRAWPRADSSAESRALAAA